jgi:hypothetical protein
MANVSIWITTIEELVAQRNIVLSDNVELFLQIDDDDCAYYFIDHVTRTEFWLDALNTDDLNIPPVVSPSHLRQDVSCMLMLNANSEVGLALEELYWVHVEHFPMHLGPLSSNSHAELISVFSHSLAGQ